MDRILKTLSMVGLKYLANLLPYGLDTMLGRRFENGQQLSIGQWQRLAMARALYKSPSLLILDEPTASVDAISENSIFDSMSQLSRNMTTVIVAHRFTTIAHSDKIIVIKDGTVHAIGSHTELLLPKNVLCTGSLPRLLNGLFSFLLEMIPKSPSYS